MKKITLLIFLMIPFLGIGQVFTNGTFDTNVDGWTVNGNASAAVTWDATEGNSAPGSLKLVTVDVDDRAQTSPNSAPLLPGDYLLTINVKGTMGNEIQFTRFQNGNANGNVDGSPTFTLATNDWEEFSYTFTALEVSNMNIRAIGKTASATYYIDDVTLVKVATLTENSFVVNPDFETSPITDSWTMGGPDTSLSTVTGNGGGSAAQVTFTQNLTNSSNNLLVNQVYDFGETINPSEINATFDALSNTTNLQIQLSIRTYDSTDTTVETLNGNNETVVTTDAWETFTYNKTVEKPFNKIELRIRFKGSPVLNDFGVIDNITATLIRTQPRNFWIGTDTDWANTANWIYGTVPVATDNVQIETNTTYPIIGSTTGAEVKSLTVDSGASLTINGGGSLIVSETSSGNVTYTRNLPSANWYMVASPVSGETIGNILANHTFVNGTIDTDHLSFAPYNNAATDENQRWDYITAASTGTLGDAQGYLTRFAGAGDISFTGSVATSDFTAIDLTDNSGSGGTAFNLLGNPYPSFIDLTAMLTANENRGNDLLTESTVWIWDGSAYTERNLATTGFNAYIAPAQGFFVSADGGSSTFTITETMQSHQGTDSFQKNTEVRPEISLVVKEGKNTANTQLFYIEGTSKDFDNGYDSSIFGGVNYDFNVYTSLASNNSTKRLGIQSLPNSDYENMIVPVGIIAENGKEITFTAEALNLPSGLKVFLEDRTNNTFTRLDEVNSEYKTTVDTKTTDGRFFLHTKSSSVLSTEDALLNSVSIYKTSNTNLKITGLNQGQTSISLYNLLGKKVMATSFNASNVNNISLPNLSTGVYIVKLEAEKGTVSKKIILE